MKPTDAFDRQLKSGKILRLTRANLLKLAAYVDREILTKSGQLNIYDDNGQADVFKSMGVDFTQHSINCLTDLKDILDFLLEENLDTMRVLQSEAGPEIRKPDPKPAKSS